MAYSLKEILKSLKVLFISKEELISEKENNILNIFFDKVIISHTSGIAIKKFCEVHPDVVITDFDLSNGCGIELCKKIRKHNPTIPIIILSQNKNEKYLFEAIRIQVIDFVVRPTKPEDLIYALNLTAKYLLNHGNVTIKLSNGNIYDYQEKTILKNNKILCKLTKNEFRLLELLLSNKGQTINKEEIESYLWADEEITESAFKSLFSRLRQKIGKENIKNSFGIGYQLV